MNNFELLGSPVRENIFEAMFFLEHKRLPLDHSYLKKAPSLLNQCGVVTCVYDILACHHLGAPASGNLLTTAILGTDVAKTYFTTDWWKKSADEDDAAGMRKSPDNDELAWFEVFSHALPMAIWAGRDDCLKALANWVECWMVPEPVAIPHDPLLGKVYISLAASFRTKPLKGLEEMEQAITKGRKKEVKLLFQAWCAAREGDQAGFDKRITESVKHFESILREPLNAGECLAMHQSSVLAAARRIGMKMPDLEPRLRARLITPESLGFSSK